MTRHRTQPEFRGDLPPFPTHLSLSATLRVLILLLMGLVIAACSPEGTDEPTDAGQQLDGSVMPDLGPTPDVPFVEPDILLGASNECGQECPAGQVCAMCLAEGLTRCATPAFREHGAACTSDAGCNSGHCALISETQGRCASVCAVDQPALCGQPADSCAPATTAGGKEAHLCLPAACGSRGSICSGESPCECAEGLACTDFGAPFWTCEHTCESGQCPTGFACADELAVCVPAGARPGGAPCEEGAACASAQCVRVGEVNVCLGVCTGCDVCPALTSGCDSFVTVCTDGICTLPEAELPGSICEQTAVCRGEEPTGTDDGGGMDGSDGMDGTDGMDGSDGMEGVEGQTGGEGQDGPDGTDGQEGTDAPDGTDGQDGSDGQGQPPASKPGDPLSCVTLAAGTVCAWTCDTQDDCDDGWICRPVPIVDGETEQHCVPIVDDDIGDCCSLTDPCPAAGVDCVQDDNVFRCAAPCVTAATCPSGYLCRAAPVIGVGTSGKHCVISPPPATVEICNGLDDDQDGETDEATAGGPLSRGCYTGPSGTAGVGICKAGQSICENGQWAPCTGQVRPVVDGADTASGCDGFDNDCDGAADEGCPCNQLRVCGIDVGPCEQGAQLCKNGVYGHCNWGTSSVPLWPVGEACDGIDNDCDGVVDNAPGQSTGTLRIPCGTLDPALDGVGLCRRGSTGCDGECTGEVLPAADECNGLDDNCDGLIDEGCDCSSGQRPCGKTAGVCEAGAQLCDTIWASECVAGNGPAEEVCDGKDNDCDGLTDNMSDSADPLERACWTATLDPDALKVGLGICEPGRQACHSGTWGGCSNQSTPQVSAGAPAGDACGDQFDNDCDGGIDEGCTCDSGDTQPCGTQEGQCTLGQQSCTDDLWTECTGATLPQREVCNGLDDNCDGLTDLAPNETALTFDCYGGDFGTLGQGECKAGLAVCIDGAEGACGGQVIPVQESCNDLDDDCDGVSDDGLACGCDADEVRACGSDVGECKTGQSQCTAGFWGSYCSGGVPPSLETCNGLDDDCDGATDADPLTGEVLRSACYTGPSMTAGIGICQSGERKCAQNGAWTTCLGEVTPGAETCDDLDNDCDGLVDEGCACTGTPRSCGTDQGSCSVGTQACVADVWADVCDGSTNPTADLCDGNDNDCDGQVDRDAASGEPVWESCYSAAPESAKFVPCQTGRRICIDGQLTGPCLGEITPALAETCDDLIDNDCDGFYEEDCL